MNEISYPYMPEGRTVKYSPADNQFMRAAEKVCREHSTDHYHPTGAVLVRDGTILLCAANTTAIKNLRLLSLHQNGLCVRKILKIPTGEKYWLCPGCARSKNHAESTLMREAGRQGILTRGADVYLWGHWWCCADCWNAMIASGIRDVYLLSGSEKFFNRANPENIIGK